MASPLSLGAACRLSGAHHEQPLEKRTVPAPPRPEEAKVSEEAQDALSDWAPTTRSPQAELPADPALASWLTACGAGERPLHEVAQAVATYRSEQGTLPELEWTIHQLRRRGAPYVQPRVWSAILSESSSQEDLAEVTARIQAWGSRPERGAHRCGIGEITDERGQRTLALVQVDAQADLVPLPTRADEGQWLDLRVYLLPQITGAAAILLPPEAPARPLHLEQNGSAWSARFLVDRPGTWLVQVLANDEGGALPVLEAHVNVGAGPFPEPWQLAVPGEGVSTKGLSEEEALLAMVNEGRRLAGHGLLASHPTLSELARQHARHLRKHRAVSHDLGLGDPTRRVEEAGLAARRVGENVARAPSVLRAYRALWASPSHRGNLLFPYFNEVGIGAVRDARGLLYVSLLFVDSR